MEKRTRVAAYALVREDGRLLLCRLAATDTEPRNPWTLPGGGLEFGESPEDAAIREVREETGLDVRLTGLAGIDSELAFEGAMHGVRILYRAERVGGDLQDEKDGSTDQARFFSPEEARRLPLVSLAEVGLRLAFPFVVRPLTTDDAQAYWDIRMEALEAEPFAFGSSAEEHRAAGFEAITSRHLRDAPNGGFTLGAFDQGRLVGIVGFGRSDRPKERHSGGVVAMYVVPEARGRGAARALLAALLDRVRAYEGLERIALSVATQATAARALYRSFGFEPYGLDRRALKVGAAYADLELMALYLRS